MIFSAVKVERLFLQDYPNTPALRESQIHTFPLCSDSIPEAMLTTTQYPTFYREERQCTEKIIWCRASFAIVRGAQEFASIRLLAIPVDVVINTPSTSTLPHLESPLLAFYTDSDPPSDLSAFTLPLSVHLVLAHELLFGWMFCGRLAHADSRAHCLRGATLPREPRRGRYKQEKRQVRGEDQQCFPGCEGRVYEGGHAKSLGNKVTFVGSKETDPSDPFRKVRKLGDTTSRDLWHCPARLWPISLRLFAGESKQGHRGVFGGVKILAGDWRNMRAGIKQRTGEKIRSQDDVCYALE